MQIQLKQTEIIAALKQYIVGQGINLTGKEVSISFTAGRKEAGIIADLVIEDASIPGFTDTPVQETPVLSVVSAVAETPKVETQATESTEASAEETPVAKTTSLFN
jgi:hypothetical protein